MNLYMRLVHSGLTLYMILILLRWVGAWMGLDMEGGRLRWIGLVTDPLIDRLRKLLPGMGPFDFGPLAALVLIWFLRTLIVRVLATTAVHTGL